jgi:hyperosmotically inducible protein
METRLIAIAAAVAMALGTLAGCDRADRDRTTTSRPAPGTTTPPNTATPSPSTTPTPSDTARSAGQTIDDAAITAKVKTALLAEKGVNGTSIDVDTSQGRVTLSGRVPDQSQVERAAQVARGVEGVKDVDNRLTASAG